MSNKKFDIETENAHLRRVAHEFTAQPHDFESMQFTIDVARFARAERQAARAEVIEYLRATGQHAAYAAAKKKFEVPK